MGIGGNTPKWVNISDLGTEHIEIIGPSFIVENHHL
jgi:hypothetical protein